MNDTLKQTGAKNQTADTVRRSDDRFDELYDLALEGDEASIHGLWAEFGFDFHKNDPKGPRRQGGAR